MSAETPPRSAVREAAAIVAFLGCVVAGGMAFAWPWIPREAPGTAALASYAPVGDGRSFLFARYGPDGRALSWESQNQEVLRPGRALAGELRKAQREALEKLYLRDEETDVTDEELLRRLRRTTLVRTVSRELKAGGEMSSNVAVSVRDGRGDFLLALYDPANDRDLVFDPAVLTAPPDLSPGRAWEAEGKLMGVLDYTFTGRVVEGGEFRGRAGAFDDCRRLETRLVLASGGSTVSDERWSGWYCAGVGVVEEQAYDAEGTPTRLRVVSAAEGIEAAGALPPPLPARAPAAPAAAGEWSLTRVGRMGQTVNASESTIRPVWIPGEPDLLLVAGQGSDLAAYDASDPTGTVVWRFHPGGTVYSPPAHDPRTGRIFFGASDKRLYALDARGLFLWSLRTGDNVATRPVVVGEVVVFGSEDRVVYGADAATGKVRWRRVTGGPVVSSPAVVGSTVVIGSDDGSVYALDAATGRERWVHATDDAVEAPVVAHEGVVYVTSRDGTVRALDPASGEALWTADAGNVVRSAAAVGPRTVYVVDDYGYVKAFDRRSGRRLWNTPRDGYTGPGVVVDGELVVARADGAVHRLDATGAKTAEWSGTGGTLDGSRPAFYLGAAAGGGAVWLADFSANVWRLGAGTGGAVPLAPAWNRLVSEAPFDMNLLTATPVEWNGRALLLDRHNHLYEVDPASGKAVRRARAAASERSALAEPTVAGSTLLLGAGNTLHAVRLPDARPLWSFRGEGTAFHPAVVSGGTVLWTTQHDGGEAGRMSGTLHAVDLSTGRLRWSHPVRGVAAVGGVVVRGGTVFLGTPATALELATGRVLWTARSAEPAVGTPALSPGGEVLHAGLVAPGGNAGSVVALATTDGGVRWRAELGEGEVLHLLERIWTAGGLLVVPSLSGRVIALDAATGAERWRYTPEAPRLGSLTVDGGRAYLALQNGQVVVLDTATGRPLARFSDVEIDLSAYGYAQRPVRVGDRLIAPLGLTLSAFRLP